MDTTTTVVVTALLTSGVWLALLFFCVRRVARHMAASPEGSRAVMEHILSPLLGAVSKPTTPP